MKKELTNIITQYNEDLENREYINKVSKLITKCAKLMVHNQTRGHYLHRNLRRLGLYFGMNEVSIYVTPKTVMYGLVYKNIEISRTITIKDKVHLNFSILSGINSLITQAILEKKTIEEVNKELDAYGTRVYSKNLVFLSTILINCAASETITGSNTITLYVFLVSSFVSFANRSLQKKFDDLLSVLFVTLVGSFLLTFISKFIDTDLPPFLASIYLLPGTLLITGVEDTMRGHILMGMSRIIMSLYRVITISGGIITGTELANLGAEYVL